MLLKEVVVELKSGATQRFATDEQDESYITVHNKASDELVVAKCRPNPDPEKYSGGEIWVDVLAVFKDWNHWTAIKTVELHNNPVKNL